MKKYRKIGIGIILLGVCVLAANLIYLITHLPKEKYPEDSFLTNEPNKSALIIVAHDDDAAPFSGTTSLLVENGWDVNFMCFYNDYWKPEENPVRKLEMKKAAQIQGFNNIELIDFNMRESLDTAEQPWMPVPYDQFSGNFKMDSLQIYILTAIQEFNPSVIFTLDDVIGAYGHPEHVIVSQVVNKVCSLYRDSLDFPVKKIYQSVLPHSQAEKIMGKMDIYIEGKRIYGCDGMPSPNVQINISSFASTKKRVFLAHASQRRALKRFIPFYHLYPGWVYFGIFNKEYFRIINVNTL